MTKRDSRPNLPAERIESAILFIRGHKVMLDADLARLYGVPTKVLNQAVKRNKDRFPPDFMFQLDAREFTVLKSQFVTSRQWGGRRIRPYVFTEQGVAMLSSVLNSSRMIRVNVEIMRAFVWLRRMLASNEELARKFKPYYLCRFYFCLFTFYLNLVAPPAPKRRRIGFLVSEKMVKYGY